MLGSRIIKGFSYLEILIGLAILMSIFMWLEGGYVVQRRAGDQVENNIEQLNVVRQVMFRLDPLVTNAGFLGVRSLSRGVSVDMQEKLEGSQMPHQAVTIHRGFGDSVGWDPPLPPVLEGKVVRGTDVLIIESAQAFPTLPHAGWFVIDDGYHAELFWQSLGKPPTLQHTYGSTAVVSPWTITAIYVDQGGLMQKSLLPSADAVNIVPGIEGIWCQWDGLLMRVTIFSNDYQQTTVWLGS